MENKTATIIGACSGKLITLTQQYGFAASELEKRYSTVINPMETIICAKSWKQKQLVELLSKDLMSADVVCILAGAEDCPVGAHLINYVKGMPVKPYIIYLK
jgi:predicted ThiF/HesA family dinucleotide-utilizing enzyme